MIVRTTTNTGTELQDSGENYELLRDSILARVPEGEKLLYWKVDRD